MLNFYEVDEQVRDDASNDDWNVAEWKHANRMAKRQREMGKLVVRAVYPDGTEKVQGATR